METKFDILYDKITSSINQSGRNAIKSISQNNIHKVLNMLEKGRLLNSNFKISEIFPGYTCKAILILGYFKIDRNRNAVCEFKHPFQPYHAIKVIKLKRLIDYVKRPVRYNMANIIAELTDSGSIPFELLDNKKDEDVKVKTVEIETVDDEHEIKEEINSEGRLNTLSEITSQLNLSNIKLRERVYSLESQVSHIKEILDKVLDKEKDSKIILYKTFNIFGIPVFKNKIEKTNK